MTDVTLTSEQFEVLLKASKHGSTTWPSEITGVLRNLYGPCPSTFGAGRFQCQWHAGHVGDNHVQESRGKWYVHWAGVEGDADGSPPQTTNAAHP